MAQATGFKLAIISQSEEGELGFRGALLATPGLSSERAVVWDIGGGSMQMVTASSEPGTLKVFPGAIGSQSFKNEVIKQIQKRDPNQIKSPNPISANQAEESIRLAQAKFASEVPIITLTHK